MRSSTSGYRPPSASATRSSLLTKIQYRQTSSISPATFAASCHKSAGPEYERSVASGDEESDSDRLEAHGCSVEVGDAALDRCVSHGVCDLFVHVRVEGVGDEFGACGEGGYLLCGGELHGEVDLLGPREEGAAEDAGVAEHVVHARSVRGEGCSRLDGLVGVDLGVGVGEGQYYLSFTHHGGVYEVRSSRRRHDDVGLTHDGLHVCYLDALFLGPLVREGVGVGADYPPRTSVGHQGGDPEACGAESDLAYHLLLECQPGVTAGDKRGSERHDGRAVHVVVHHGYVEGLFEAGLYLEALWRRDVLEVDSAERRRYAYDGLYELICVFGVDQDGHRRDTGELVVEDGLPLHHGHRGDGTYISQTQNARAVRADGDAAPDHRQLAGE